MTKRDVIAAILCDRYKQDKRIDIPEFDGFVRILSFAGEQTQWTDEFLRDMMNFKSKSKDKLHITEIIPTSCKDLPHYSNNLKYKEKGKKTYPIFGDNTGLFKIKFNDNSFIYFAKWYSGGGKSTMIESMWATEDVTWNNWLKLFQSEKKRLQKPKVGVWRAVATDFGLRYEPIKKIPNNRIFHSELGKIRDTVNYYFNNVSSYMKYNQAGRRSLLLYGEQGTSKTSTLYQLSIEHSKTKSVVFSTDINALAQHIVSCEKYNTPTLCFFEDAEGAFSQNHSGIKNFLSGIDAKQNKGGTCIVYTTNYPEKIEETIIQRPERIDELFYIGPIEGQTLLECIEYYFGDYLPKGTNLSRIISKPMTGAEVKLLVENTLRYCAANRVEINEESISAVINKYIADIKKLNHFKDKVRETVAKRSEKKEKMGFGFEEKEEESIFSLPSNGNGHY